MSDDNEVFEEAMAGLFGATKDDPREVRDEALFAAEMAAHEEASDEGVSPPKPPEPRRRSGPGETDKEADRLFEAAMGAMGLGAQSPASAPVADAPPEPHRRAPSAPSVPGESDAVAASAFEEAMATLKEVPTRNDEGEEVVAPIDPTSGAPDVLRRRVRKGLLRHESELDLHRMTQAQARAAVASYLSNSAAQGVRVTRIICGRGLHSRAGAMLLRDSLPTWLRADFSEAVETAFRAPPGHGGEGAWYAILRR